MQVIADFWPQKNSATLRLQLDLSQTSDTVWTHERSDLCNETIFEGGHELALFRDRQNPRWPPLLIYFSQHILKRGSLFRREP